MFDRLPIGHLFLRCSVLKTICVSSPLIILFQLICSTFLVNSRCQAEEKETQSPPAATAAANAATWETIVVPENGSIDDLVKFVAKVKLRRPLSVDQFREMQEAISAGSKQIMKLSKEQNNDIYRSAELDNISSSVMLLTNDGPENQQKTIDSFIAYLKNRPLIDDNDVRIMLLAGQNLEQFKDLAPAIKAYETFAGILKDRKESKLDVWVQLLESNARRLNLPGHVMKIEGKTLGGEEFNIESVRGKIVLVYFWASWSVPCMQELPFLKKLYAEYQAKGFEIVAVAVDEDQSKIQSFLKTHEIEWLNLWDESNRTDPKVVREYGISVIPSQILLDKDGRVLLLEARGEVLAKSLQNLLAPVPVKEEAKQP